MLSKLKINRIQKYVRVLTIEFSSFSCNYAQLTRRVVDYGFHEFTIFVHKHMFYPGFAKIHIQLNKSLELSECKCRGDCESVSSRI